MKVIKIGNMQGELSDIYLFIAIQLLQFVCHYSSNALGDILHKVKFIVKRSTVYIVCRESLMN